MAGALRPVEVMKRANHDMHMGEVIICYGQTETSPVNHMAAIDALFERGSPPSANAVLIKR